MREIKIGDDLPIFSLRDQHNDLINSRNWIGAPVVVYFYPSDFTRFCTAQACSFRNHFADFKNFNVRIIGISFNSVASHKKFAEEYKLPYTILSDPNNIIRNTFGVASGILGLGAGRVTYVFDKKGKLVFRYKADFKAKEHILKALEVIEGLNEDKTN